MLMKIILFVSILCVPQLSLQKSSPTSPTYIAAVVEYSPEVILRENYVDEVPKNIKDYIFLIQKAAEQSVDIIIFPESGLSIGETRYYSILPDPVNKVNPCTNASSDVAEGVRLLSCAARNASIYVVVNLTEKKPCIVSSETSCASADILYNTDVAFDREGVVIARYRKYNLFGEPGIGITAEPDYSIFETDFGVKFGMFTCFDIQFEKPAITLIKEHGITDFVFPTHWFSELPFLSALQAQSSWAYGMDVNFLASGYNNPRTGSCGSGIYLGKEGPLKATMPSVPTTQLLVHTVQKKTSSPTKCFASNSSNVCSAYTSLTMVWKQDIKDDATGSGIYMKRDYLEPYKTIPLTEDKFSGKETLCHEKLCCSFEVEMHTVAVENHTSSRYGYLYRLAVFDGVRSYDGFATGGLQNCAIIFCSNESISSCGVELNRAKPETFQTVFDHIHISGNFNLKNASQLPVTLIDGYGVLSSDKFTFIREELSETDEVKVTMNTTKKNLRLMTFGIFGRNFEKDGSPMTLPENNGNKGNKNNQVEGNSPGSFSNSVTPALFIVILSFYLPVFI